MNRHTTFAVPSPDPSPFYEAARQLSRIEDSCRLIREAEQIAANYADRRWGKAVPS